MEAGRPTHLSPLGGAARQTEPEQSRPCQRDGSRLRNAFEALIGIGLQQDRVTRQCRHASGCARQPCRSHPASLGSADLKRRGRRRGGQIRIDAGVIREVDRRLQGGISTGDHIEAPSGLSQNRAGKQQRAIGDACVGDLVGIHDRGIKDLERAKIHSERGRLTTAGEGDASTRLIELYPDRVLMGAGLGTNICVHKPGARPGIQELGSRRPAGQIEGTCGRGQRIESSHDGRALAAQSKPP